jgi:hypothetical protein
METADPRMMLDRDDVDASLHNRCWSRHSSNKSAEILGSQYLLGRPARAEGALSSTCCGTNGWMFSQ